MKNLISKVALLLLCSAFALSSCSDDDSVEKKTVTMKYRIMVSANVDYNGAGSKGGIEKLYEYTKREMEIVSEQYGREPWLITETAETEKAAIKACDDKATAEFEGRLPEINAATKLIEEKFNAKKAELSSEIAADPAKCHIIYRDYGGILFKGKEDIPFPKEQVAGGLSVDLEAVGGKK